MSGGTGFFGGSGPSGGAFNTLYPTSWYYADTNFAAKAVSAAADRYILLTPNQMQIDIGGSSYRLAAQTSINLSTATNWGKNVAARASSTAYVLGDVIPTPSTNAYYWECTTAGTSASSDPGSWGTAVGNTKVDGGVTWTARFANPTTAANRAGYDFYVYACQPTSGATPVFKVSPNSTTPYGYSTTTSRKVGGFHCLCVDMSAPATRANGTAYALGNTVISSPANGYWYVCTTAGTSAGSQPTMGTTIGGTTADGTATWTCESIHLASGYLAGDIIPNSVWDLSFRAAASSNAGLAYIDALDEWVGIYSASGSALVPTITYGGTYLASTTWVSWVEVAARLNMQLSEESHFSVYAMGSNVKTNISTGAKPTTTGGSSCTGGRRMLSKYFLEECCGAGLQHCKTVFFPFHGTVNHTHEVTVSGEAQTVASANPGAALTLAYSFLTISGSRGSILKQGSTGISQMLVGGAYDGGSGCGVGSRTLVGGRDSGDADVFCRFTSKTKRSL